MLTSAKHVATYYYSMTMDVIYEKRNLIGHVKFLLWQQLDGCNVTSPFLSVKGVACE